MSMADLTIKQENFCQAYVRLLDKSAAYREAYGAGNMKPETINETSCKLFSNPKIVTRVKQLQAIKEKVVSKKFGTKVEDILNHLNVLSNSRIDEYVEFENGVMKFKDFSKLSEEQLMCIESIKQGRYGVEIKLHGKDWTLDKIAKHIGFYEKDNSQKKPEPVVSIDFSKVSDEALEEFEKAQVKQ